MVISKSRDTPILSRIALLRERVAAFYTGWNLPEFEPYTRYNSRF